MLCSIGLSVAQNKLFRCTSTNPRLNVLSDLLRIEAAAVVVVVVVVVVAAVVVVVVVVAASAGIE